jgi:hypothetical protein
MLDHKSILQKQSAKDYAKAVKAMTGISNCYHPLVEKAVELAGNLEPIELVVIELSLPDNFKKDACYVEALSSEWAMFEVAYLRSVTGSPPYTDAIEFGLNDDDIKKYQQQWINVELDPLTVKTVYTN